jgi:hypothetical protein
MKLTALMEFYYAGQTVRPGQQFECMGETDLRVLTAPDALGGQRARRSDESDQVHATGAGYMASAGSLFPMPEPMQTMAIEPEQADEPTDTDNPQRRRYRRRDMEPEK